MEELNHRWYVIHTYSGHENKVVSLINQRVVANGLQNEVLDIIVPTNKKILVKDGKKKTVDDRVLPGYVLINMHMSENAWHIVKNTEGVIGFIGTGKMPSPLPPHEVKEIKARLQSKTEPVYHSDLTVGDAVKVIDGVFKNFVGSINEINKDKAQVVVLLSIFGRETPVTLDFLEVSRL